MKIETAIEKAKSKLIEKAKKSGIYENFGQKEVRMIESKYVNPLVGNHEEYKKAWNTLCLFDNWCSTYNG